MRAMLTSLMILCAAPAWAGDPPADVWAVADRASRTGVTYAAEITNRSEDHIRCQVILLFDIGPQVVTHLRRERSNPWMVLKPKERRRFKGDARLPREVRLDVQSSLRLGDDIDTRVWCEEARW